MALNQHAPSNPQPSSEISSLKFEISKEGWVWAMSAFARRYSRNHGCFLLLRVLRWFTSPGWLAPAYIFSGPFPMFSSEGFPHSEIPGSKGVSPLPRLIAGNHVLHRRLAPRHPPYALSSLTITSAQHTKQLSALSFKLSAKRPGLQASC
jgi:hypothetical protein